MRYKVGDRVVIRKDLIVGECYFYEGRIGQLLFNKSMSKFRGKICEVIEITDSVLDEYHLLIDDEKIGWYFNNAMLLPAGSLRYLVMKRRQPHENI